MMRLGIKHLDRYHYRFHTNDVTSSTSKVKYPSHIYIYIYVAVTDDPSRSINQYILVLTGYVPTVVAKTRSVVVDSTYYCTIFMIPSSVVVGRTSDNIVFNVHSRVCADT